MYLTLTACNVLYLNTVDMESLTGREAVARAVKVSLHQQPPPKTTVVHFKVNSQGITLTDNKRRYDVTDTALAHAVECANARPRFIYVMVSYIYYVR